MHYLHQYQLAPCWGGPHETTILVPKRFQRARSREGPARGTVFPCRRQPLCSCVPVTEEQRGLRAARFFPCRRQPPCSCVPVTEEQRGLSQARFFRAACTGSFIAKSDGRARPAPCTPAHWRRKGIAVVVELLLNCVGLVAGTTVSKNRAGASPSRVPMHIGDANGSLLLSNFN